MYWLMCEPSLKASLIFINVDTLVDIILNNKSQHLHAEFSNFVSVFKELEEKTQTALVDADPGERSDEQHEEAYGNIFLLSCLASITTEVIIMEFNSSLANDLAKWGFIYS